MKKVLAFLLALATGGAFAGTPPVKQEAVLPLQNIESSMTAPVKAAAKKAGLETVVVRMDTVNGEKRYAVRLPASVWADTRLWPSRACGNDRGCLAEFGRLNALPDGWVKYPLARGDAYFPLNAKNDMPAVKGGVVVHATRLTRSMQPRAVVSAKPAKGDKQRIAQVAPATPRTPASKPETEPENGKSATQKGEKQEPKPAPLAPPTGVRIIETVEKPPVAYREVVVVQYEPACRPGWNNSTCTERREVSRRVVRVQVTETAVAQRAPTAPAQAQTVAVAPEVVARSRVARPAPSQQPAPAVAPKVSANVPVSTFAGLLHAFQGVGPNELILGVRGACTNGVCHATLNGKTVSITPQVGNEIIAKKQALKAQEQAVTLARK